MAKSKKTTGIEIQMLKTPKIAQNRKCLFSRSEGENLRQAKRAKSATAVSEEYCFTSVAYWTMKTEKQNKIKGKMVYF